MRYLSFLTALSLMVFQGVKVSFDTVHSFLSSGFITTIVINPTERKLTKRTFVQWMGMQGSALFGVPHLKTTRLPKLLCQTLRFSQKFTYIGSNSFRLDHIGQVGSNWLRLDQIGSDRIRLDQIGSEGIKRDQKGSDWIRLDQIRSDWT